MKLRATSCLLLGLAILVGCSSPAAEQAEHAGPDELTPFFGEHITYTKGSHLSTNATEPQGQYLEITVHDDKLAQQYGDLGLPASNCAYLAFKNLPAAERRQYDYLKVTMPGVLTAHSYTFTRPELALAIQAAADLDDLMKHFRAHEYTAIVNSFAPQAITPAIQAQLPAYLATIEQKTGPVQQYYLEGFAPTKAPLAGKTQSLIRLFVALSRPQKAGRMLVVIDPSRHPNEKFLCGLNILE